MLGLRLGLGLGLGLGLWRHRAARQRSTDERLHYLAGHDVLTGTQNRGSFHEALAVRSIISLAHSLAVRVNAEGVEAEAQYATLRRHGCDELQGFLLGRPQLQTRLAHLDFSPDPAC